MIRKFLGITEGEAGIIRAALRTLAEQDAGDDAMVARCMVKLENAPAIDKRDWREYQQAAGEILEAGADEAAQHVNVKACDRFAAAMNRAFGKARRS